ncbi:MAG: hypothetical protein ACFFEV_00740 [Candidatus Thorarchaeota archaeon]
MVNVKVSVPYHRIVPDKPISGDFCVEITVEPEHAIALATAILARPLQLPNQKVRIYGHKNGNVIIIDSNHSINFGKIIILIEERNLGGIIDFAD